MNVLTVFPARSSEVDAYRSVARAMRRLALACDRRGADDPPLRRACFGPAAAPPEGEGVDRSEAQDEEEPIVVDGLHYDPLIARRLNPDIALDRALVSGLEPPADKIWFGVFLRVCNRGEQSRTSSDRLALVDAFGQRTKASDALPQDNPFFYSLPHAPARWSSGSGGALRLRAPRDPNPMSRASSETCRPGADANELLRGSAARSVARCCSRCRSS